MSIKCPFCGEYFITDYQSEEVENMIHKNEESNDILKGLKSQIKNIASNVKNNQINNTFQELNNATIIIDSVLKNMNDSIDKLKSIESIIKQNKKKYSSLSNTEGYHLKGSKSWQPFVAESLFNKKINGDIYNNILTKAALVGKNGAFWAYSSNFIISPFQINEIKKFFNEESNSSKKKFEIDDIDYEIVNYNPGVSLELKEGENGATIANMKSGYVFGFFNANINYRVNGKPFKQNMELCKKVVLDLANALKSQGY
jgi:hypothetical protein